MQNSNIFTATFSVVLFVVLTFVFTISVPLVSCLNAATVVVVDIFLAKHLLLRL